MDVRRPAPTLLVVTLVACGGGGTGPIVDGTTLTARIDGVAWVADPGASAQNSGRGVYEIVGSDTSAPDDYTLSVVLENLKGPGTYALGVGPTILGGNGYLARGTNTWSTTWTGAEGEVVITALSATRIVGTFEFSADPNLATAVRAVSEGVFDLPVVGTFGPATDGNGHWIEGIIHGPFIATTADLVWPDSVAPTLTVTGRNSSTQVAFTLRNVPGVGTYALSTSSPVRSVTVIGSPTQPSWQWTSAITGGGGSVTVTSVTASRIMGTFAATVIGYAGGATGPLSISGTFSMGRGVY